MGNDKLKDTLDAARDKVHDLSERVHAEGEKAVSDAGHAIEKAKADARYALDKAKAEVHAADTDLKADAQHVKDSLKNQWEATPANAADLGNREKPGSLKIQEALENDEAKALNELEQDDIRTEEEF